MRRIGQIDRGVRVWRLEGDTATRLSRHAFVHPGDTLRIRSAQVSYGDKGITIETVDGQKIVKRERVVLDIANGTSRERVDQYGKSTNLLIFSKSQEDFSRHKAAVDAESRRGVLALWNDTEFDCIIGDIGEEREYPGGGFDKSFGGLLVANRRQFFIENGDGKVIEKAPAPKSFLTVNGENFTVEEVRRDISVLTFRLARKKPQPGDY